MSTAKQLASKATAAITKANDSFFSELETLRGKISELQTEIEWTRNAPLPQDEAIKRIESYIDYQRSEFSAGSCVATLSAPDGRTGDIQSFKPTASSGNDLAPMLAWLFPDRMKTALTETLNDVGLESGLPFAERGARVRKLEDKLLALETEEEALVVSAEQLGLQVFRRPDANPEVVLGLPGEDVKPQPKPYVSRGGQPYDQHGNAMPTKKQPIRTVGDLPADAFNGLAG